METYAIQQLRRYDALLSINASNLGSEFKVKVMKKWITKDVIRMGKIVSVDMILADQTGHKIQATIPEMLCPMFDKKIVEGKVYLMSNFTIKTNMGQHLASFHRNLLVFNDRTVVQMSWGCGFPTHGLDLIGSKDVLSLKDKFQFLVDVIEVITYIRHDKNIYLDGTTTKTVTLKLTDNKKCSNTFECELFGGYVELFRQLMEEKGLGLPVVALQWVKVTKNQGRSVVQSVDGITKIYMNPTFYDALKFRNGLVIELNRKPKTHGFPRRDKPIAFSFTTQYHCKSISQLMEDPTLGIYLINGRIMDVAALDTWWYPVCGCDLIIEDYLGDFFCGKCHATDFVPMLKYRVKMVVEDESATTFFEAFDHVMLPIAVVDPTRQGITRTYFPQAFDHVIGKSIMFIVEKKKHNKQYIDGMFELLCVSDDREIIKYYVDKGICSTPSKEVAINFDKDRSLMKQIAYDPPQTTVTKLLVEYLNPISENSPYFHVGESSNAAAPNSDDDDDDDFNLRSVRPRLV
ncbi:hypothetical protein P8452_71898 [Trifolium repens]|nr:hypothetical protein P8452_71898 [Trifolium repens]